MTRFIIAAGAIILTLALICGTAGAQDLDERLKRLEEQNKKLVDQNRRLTDSHNEIIRRLGQTETQNRNLAEQLDRRDAHDDRRIEAVIGQLDAALSEMTPSASGGYGDARPGRYGNITRSGGTIQLYGRIRLDSFYNTARFNRSVDAQWVTAEDGINAKNNDATFTLSARLTTLGANWDLGEINGGRARAKLEFDFAGFGSESESQANVRLLLAYFDLDYGDWSMRFGQDWDVVSPLDPVVDEFRHLWDTGNVGDRRPLAQLAYHPRQQGSVSFEIRVALGVTGTVLEGDAGDEDVGFGAFLSTEVDGFDAALPHVQLATSVSIDSWVDGERMSFGVSGLIGKLQTDFDFGGENDFTTWLVSVDFLVPICDQVHIKGEGFLGSAVGDFRGGIGQSINQTTGDEIDTIGGWAEIFWQATDRFGMGFGGSIDNPDQEDLDLAMRASNWTLYVATRYDFGSGLSMGLDAIFWRTEYIGREAGDAFRFNWFVQLEF